MKKPRSAVLQHDTITTHIYTLRNLVRVLVKVNVKFSYRTKNVTMVGPPQDYQALVVKSRLAN